MAEKTCEKFSDGSWSEYNITLHFARSKHLSYVTDNGVILIGGTQSPNTSEIVGFSDESDTINNNGSKLGYPSR